METNPTPKPLGYDGERLQVTPGDAENLAEVRDAEDAGGGGHVTDEDLNDPGLQAVVWPPSSK
ncbi:MAG TPA: hypothetical protein PKU78_06595 [Candidatus Dojkabacteria bacterium]|nr:hypothetical protein [Candidatus Dojkabacteria bacterium]HRO65867.1 hypothetical protein [Candidatus Dojkabacteria bacterium]HRP36738.1 hypothetical protein [Candidatus Dojkabacteria bacterium]HRP51302.1 hypothetical protein [Candidatus Dojkabacteria bacterium]